MIMGKTQKHARILCKKLRTALSIDYFRSMLQEFDQVKIIYLGEEEVNQGGSIRKLIVGDVNQDAGSPSLTMPFKEIFKS